MDVNVEELDVFSVENVLDIGNGEPLFFNFTYEDWILLSVRFELHLLLHSFKKDLNDDDRPGFTEEHLPFYYGKYLKKPWSVKSFGVASFADFLEFVKDTVSVGDKGFLHPEMSEDTPTSNFVKVVEEYRRERQRRIDAGDETAQLKFTRTPGVATATPAKGQGKGVARAAYGGKGEEAYLPPAAVRTTAGYGRPAPSSGYARAPAAGATARAAPASYGAQKRPYSPAQPSAAYGSAGKAARTTYGKGYGY